MPKITRRIARAAARTLKDAETRALAAEGRRSIETKVKRAKHTLGKALKAGATAGAVVAAAVVLRDRRKRRKLDG